MQPEARKLVSVALNAAETVSAFIGERTFEAHAADPLLPLAVERLAEVVGGALAQLRRQDPEMASRIPDLARIVAFRNILTHGYGSVDQKIVWESIGVDLDPLKDRLRAILDQDRA